MTMPKVIAPTCCEQEIEPAAAEELAEAATGGAGAKGCQPDRVIARPVLDAQEMALEFVQGIILLECPPSQLADGRQGRHIDAVLRALAELCVGMLLVVDVEHQRRVHDVLVDAVFRDAHVGCRAHHVADGAVTVRAVLHQKLSRVQQEMHLPANLGERLLEALLVFRLHDSAPFSGVLHEERLC